MGIFSFLFGKSENPHREDKQVKEPKKPSKEMAIKDLLDMRGEYFSFLPEDFASAVFNAQDKGETHIEVTDEILAEIGKNKAYQEKRDSLYKSITDLRLQGKEMEKSDTGKAVECYKEAIELGENAEIQMFHAYAYAYERLFVLLHKSNPELEMKFLEAYLKHEIPDGSRKKYEERYAKLKFKSL